MYAYRFTLQPNFHVSYQHFFVSCISLSAGHAWSFVITFCMAFVKINTQIRHLWHQNWLKPVYSLIISASTCSIEVLWIYKSGNGDSRHFFTFFPFFVALNQMEANLYNFANKREQKMSSEKINWQSLNIFPISEARYWA